jgi:hypothetical protein
VILMSTTTIIMVVIASMLMISRMPIPFIRSVASNVIQSMSSHGYAFSCPVVPDSCCTSLLRLLMNSSYHIFWVVACQLVEEITIFGHRACHLAQVVKFVSLEIHDSSSNMSCTGSSL